MKNPPRTSLMDVYLRLIQRYGPQNWWPGDSPFEIVVGAILGQAVAWNNVEKSIINLKSSGAFSIEGLRNMSEEEIAVRIRPSGYFNQKAKKLKAFISYIWEQYNGDMRGLFSLDVRTMRRELLSIYGIGNETADDIVLYAAQKASFVVDEYTCRILTRLGKNPKGDGYEDYQSMFHKNLKADVLLFNEYHALLVRHGKEICKKTPKCDECCLFDVCPTGLAMIKSG